MLTAIPRLPQVCCVVLLPLLACAHAPAQEITPLDVVRATTSSMLLVLQRECQLSAQESGRLYELVAEIEQPGGTPIPISYSMYLSDNDGKVYAAAISSVSLVTNYRSSFGSSIRKDGMDSLIEQLGNRNGAGSDG